MPRVLALADGFYQGRRIRKGVEFLVDKGATAKWFVALDTEVAKAAKAPKAPKPEPTTLAAMAGQVAVKDPLAAEGSPGADLA